MTSVKQEGDINHILMVAVVRSDSLVFPLLVLPPSGCPHIASSAVNHTGLLSHYTV